MDNLKKTQRSYCMSRIRSYNTKAEVLFRKLLWANEIRSYRLKSKITGKPDLYFSKAQIAVFIDGCFWHHCLECYKRPKTNKKYWDKKIAGNVKRDEQINKKLIEQGIKVIRFWEHEIKKNTAECLNKLKEGLNEKAKNS